MSVTETSLPARMVQVAGAPSGSRIQRFTRTERTVHWVQAVTFLLLLVSGFVLALPQFEAAIGHRALLREIHLSSAFFFVFGPSIVALAGDRISIRRDLHEIDQWDRDDALWLVPSPVLQARGETTPPQGRFNAGQKLNAIFVAWSTVTFAFTGLIMWQNRRFPIDMVHQANTIHTVLAYVALLGFLGHIFLATVYPPTRHAFRAITEGWVDRRWAEHHHAKWVRAIVPRTEPARFDGPRALMQTALGLAIAAFATRLLLFALGANTTDQVTSWLYAATAWPGVPSVVPRTAVQTADWPAAAYLLVCLFLWFGVDRLRRSGAQSPE